MKYSVKIGVMAAVMTLGLARTWADLQTNLVQDLDVELVGFAQGGSVTDRNVVKTSVNYVRVRNGDIIAALGTATGNTFSSQARLVLITPLPSGSPTIAIRDGSVSVDVSAFLSLGQDGVSVGSSVVNQTTGRSSGSSYALEHLTLQDPSAPITPVAPLTLHFDVRGLGVETFVQTPTLGTRGELDANVSGSGDDLNPSNGKPQPLLLQGLIRVHGYKLEVVDPPPVTT